MKRSPVAILDACVLVPMPLADTLLRLSEPPALFEARWSDDILAEVTRTLVRRFSKSPEKARYREESMREYFPHALVKDYRSLVGRMRNHPKDRHVLAAAVACKADCLVTFNLKDFAPSAVRGHSVSIIGPSAFLKELWQLDRTVVEERLQEQAEAIGVSKDILLSNLAKAVPGFVAVVRAAEP
jgi:predicted nucleic acid-binding protein